MFCHFFLTLLFRQLSMTSSYFYIIFLSSQTPRKTSPFLLASYFLWLPFLSKLISSCLFLILLLHKLYFSSLFFLPPIPSKSPPILSFFSYCPFSLLYFLLFFSPSLNSLFSPFFILFSLQPFHHTSSFSISPKFSSSLSPFHTLGEKEYATPLSSTFSYFLFL